MTPRQRSPLRLRSLAAAAAIVISIAACQATASPSPSAASPSAVPPSAPAPSSTPTPPAASVDSSAIYREIEEEVLALRGLKAAAPVDPVVLDGEGIRKLTEDSFRKDNPEDYVEANERLYKGLGLLPADASLEEMYLELLGSQVAGVYRPEDKTLYVVSKSGAIGPTEKTTFAHEYTHALQDQNFDFESLDISEIGEGDRGIARLSLVEGDATLAMSLWQIENLSQLELFQLIGESLNPEVTGDLEAMPPVLRESLLFPYTGGMNFVQTLQAGGWQAVNDAYANPPASTEQILHPEKYLAGEEPLDVTLPDDLASGMGEGWKVGLEDTFGEFQLGIWLDQAAAASGGVSSDTAAAGWGGDRIALLDGPSGASAIALSTAWDTPEDADEFAGAATNVVEGLDGAGDVIVGADGTSVTVVLASNAEDLARLKAALGS